MSDVGWCCPSRFCKYHTHCFSSTTRSDQGLIFMNQRCGVQWECSVSGDWFLGYFCQKAAEGIMVVCVRDWRWSRPNTLSRFIPCQTGSFSHRHTLDGPNHPQKGAVNFWVGCVFIHSCVSHENNTGHDSWFKQTSEASAKPGNPWHQNRTTRSLLLHFSHLSAVRLMAKSPR